MYLGGFDQETYSSSDSSCPTLNLPVNWDGTHFTFKTRTGASANNPTHLIPLRINHLPPCPPPCHLLHLLLVILTVPASALGGLGLSGLLVLGHLELLVRIAPCAEGVPSLGHVHHLEAFLR